MNIVTEYNSWYIIFCLILGFLYSFFLYRNDKKFNNLEKWKINIMRTLRFLSASFLFFLLLNPMIKTVNKIIEKPIIIFATDNSESIIINKDSSFYKNEYQKNIENFLKSFSEDFDIKTYNFGEKLKKGLAFDFSEKQTNYTEFFNSLKNKFFNRNVGALVIASDGIYNKGSNPIYAASNINFPIYTIAMGDTSVKKDIILSKVKANEIAFIGNEFPLQIFVKAKELKNEITNLEIFHKKKVVFSKEININSNDFLEKININLKAENKGLQNFHLKLSKNSQEISFKNNFKNLVIDVIDNQQKILILANSPHPDISAIKKAIELNPNYKIKVSLISDFKGQIENYNLLILHQIPTITNSATDLLKKISKIDIPIMFILNSHSNLKQINNLQFGLNINNKNQNFEEVQAHFNNKFNLFKVNEEIIKFFEKAPPFISPFGDYKINASTNVLCFQKIKNIKTEKPLIFFNNISDKKIGFITGEGIWRWRMFDFMENQNHNLFNELINKLIQFNSLKINKDNFNVKAKKLFNENEAIIFDAQVYNESFESDNSQDVNIEIVNSDGKNFNFIFDKSQDFYHLNIGYFPVGTYTYNANVEIGKKIYKKTGKFTVLSVNIESKNTNANHKILYQLAENHKGKMFQKTELENLKAEIEKNKNLVAIAYSEKSLQDLIYLKWIFFIVLIIISTEWFLRKYLGTY